MFCHQDLRKFFKQACREGDRYVVTCLLRRPCKLQEERIKLLEDGLHNAAYGGQTVLIQFFIELGVDNWDRGLLGAAKGGRKELIDFFIEKGATNLKAARALTDWEDHSELREYLSELIEENKRVRTFKVEPTIGDFIPVSYIKRPRRRCRK